MHGFGIARRIAQVSGGVFRVNPGSLLLGFRRLERDGLIDAAWQKTELNRRARVYSLTAKGRRRLADEQDEWKRRTMAMARVLEA
jgi:PadR family transcriptional regulator PadR